MGNDSKTFADITHAEWNSVIRPFVDHLRFTAKLDDFERLSKHGLWSLSRQADWANSILMDSGVPPEQMIKDDEPLKKASEAAQREISGEYDLLHNQMLVLLWSNLEETIRQVVTAVVRSFPKTINVDRIQKIRIPLATMLSLDEADRALYLVELLDADLGSSLSKGVGRFEKILDVLSLGGSVPDSLARDILELQQRRHLVAHRRGITDAKFQNACPWLSVETGQPIKTDNVTFERLKIATVKYVGELGYRLSSRRGHSAMLEIFSGIRDGKSLERPENRASPSEPEFLSKDG